MAVGLAAAWALAPAAKGTALGAVVGSSAPDDQPASFLPHSPGGYGLTLLMAAAALASVAALRRRGVLSGHAFATARRRVENLSALGWFAAGVAIYAALVLGQGLGSALAPGADHPTNLSSMAGIFGSGYAAALAVTVAVLIALRKPARAAGFFAGAFDPVRGLIAFLLVLPIVWTVGAGAALLVRLIGAGSPSPVAHETLRRLAEAPMDLWWWAVVVAVVLGAPVVEEVIYRGFVQTAVLRATGSGWAAVLVTAAAFTLVHVGAVDASGLAALFALAVGFGVAFERTGRLGVPAVMHAAFNLFNVAVVTLPG